MVTGSTASVLTPLVDAIAAVLTILALSVIDFDSLHIPVPALAFPMHLICSLNCGRKMLLRKEQASPVQNELSLLATPVPQKSYLLHPEYDSQPCTYANTFLKTRIDTSQHDDSRLNHGTLAASQLVQNSNIVLARIYPSYPPEAYKKCSL